MKSILIKSFTWVVLFAISMAFMESAVVVYLRELYYPGGFAFPLKPISPFIAKVEFFREVATVIMLLGIGIIAGKTKLQRFAWFVLAFAIWDIFYYVFLYICLGWPQSLSTWDILFLVPVPWVGPVWAPCLLSLLMIAGSVFIIVKTETNPAFKISPLYWWMLLSGAFVCIVSFMWDYLSFTYNKEQTWSVFSDQKLFSDIETYIPQQFNVFFFLAGFIPMFLSVLFSIITSIKKNI